MKVYCNGDFQDKDNLREIFEPGFLFGWGVFEPLRTYRGNIPFLHLHIERLRKSLALIGLDDIELEWDKVIKSLLKENGLEDAYIRITVYKRREGTGVIIYASPFDYYPSPIYKEGFTSIISPYRRNVEEVCSQIKTISYLENRLSWFEAQRANKNEAVVLSPQGSILGGARSNLFVVRKGEVVTPSLERGAFPGITRQVVIDILADFKIPLQEKDIKLEDIYESEEMFLTSALMEVMPLVECEGKVVGRGKPGEITLKVLSRYREIVQIK
jgi:branched-chain amino acid aminotransferase